MNYRTILVPLDGSALARTAIPEASALARASGGKLILAGVVEVPAAQWEGYSEIVSGLDIHERMVAQLQATLEGWVSELRAEGVEAECVVREGIAHEEIVALCAERHADLVVMTTHGRRGFTHMLLGSVAEKVVRSAPCSVLVIRTQFTSDSSVHPNTAPPRGEGR